MMGDKQLPALSPGERGALLLLFYLFIDMDDKPLIIDQPEENLDNESVYNYLVHFIKEAKQKRQIIIVTHNPNLAVVCDADQIVEMKIDKSYRNKVSFQSGAIENSIIHVAIGGCSLSNLPQYVMINTVNGYVCACAPPSPPNRCLSSGSFSMRISSFSTSSTISCLICR